MILKLRVHLSRPGRFEVTAPGDLRPRCCALGQQDSPFLPLTVQWDSTLSRPSIAAGKRVATQQTKHRRMFFCDGETADDGGGVGHSQLVVVGPGTAGAPLRLHQADVPSSNCCHCSAVQHQQQQHLHHNHNLHHQHHNSAFTMAAYQNHQDELAQLQELSNKWEPDATVFQGSQQPCPARARTD